MELNCGQEIEFFLHSVRNSLAISSGFFSCDDWCSDLELMRFYLLLLSYLSRTTNYPHLLSFVHNC